MHKSLKSMTKSTIVAAAGAVLALALAAPVWGQDAKQAAADPTAPRERKDPTAPRERKVKDMAEYDIFNGVLKDQNSNNPQKALQDLDVWTEKYPESDWKDQRLYMYMQEYAKLTPPNAAKVMDYGAQVMAKGLKTVFDEPKEAPRQIMNFLFLITVNITGVAEPTPDQIALGAKAAQQLKDEAKAYFVPANKPAATPDAAWTQARAQLDSAADHTALYLAILPANLAKAKGDCAGAEAMYVKALQDRPDSAYISYQLANNMICLQKTQPEMAAQAIYEFERAAVVDPTMGDPKVDPTQLPKYADGLYARIHGSDEGLADLKALAKANPLPPAGFKIKTKDDIQAEKDAEFARSNPKLALWIQVKNALTAADGEQYFATQLKDSQVPPLSGVLVEGKPACRSKELLVAIMPGQGGAPTAEISLKLDTALTAKPEPGSEIQFEAIPSAFTKAPFLLTMEAEKAKVTVKISPCAAPAPRAPAKKK